VLERVEDQKQKKLLSMKRRKRKKKRKGKKERKRKEKRKRRMKMKRKGKKKKKKKKKGKERGMVLFQNRVKEKNTRPSVMMRRTMTSMTRHQAQAKRIQTGLKSMKLKRTAQPSQKTGLEKRALK
jgi:hypothetical protein